MFRPHLFVAALVLVLAIGGSSAALEFKIGQVGVATPWARATIGAGKTGVIYLTIHNRGSGGDRLIAVLTPIAKRAALHTHQMDNGVMKMRPVEAIQIAPGKTASLAPGRMHIMLMGLKYKLVKGGSFPLTLTFAGSGSATITVNVQSATASRGHAHSGGHKKSDE